MTCCDGLVVLGCEGLDFALQCDDAVLKHLLTEAAYLLDVLDSLLEVGLEIITLSSGVTQRRLQVVDLLFVHLDKALAHVGELLLLLEALVLLLYQFNALFELLGLRQCRLQWLCEALVLLGDIEHELVIRDLLLLHLLHFVLQRLNQLQVAVRDLEIVALHLVKVYAVLLDEALDLVILVVFNLLDLRLPP